MGNTKKFKLKPNVSNVKKGPNPNLQSEELEFPVNFDIKIIMENTGTLEENINALKAIFDSLAVPHKTWRHKESKNGTYISFTANTTLESREKMEALYHRLKDVPGIKMVL